MIHGTENKFLQNVRNEKDYEFYHHVPMSTSLDLILELIQVPQILTTPT